MKIIKEKTKYHRFALYYKYDQAKVEFCQNLKDSFGWFKFSFEADGNLKRWVFSESFFIPVIIEKFPEVIIADDVRKIVDKEQKWLTKVKKQENAIEKIKTKTETTFNIKGLKKKLYNYQKVGVEFLDKTNGRAIIADQMGLGKTCQAIAYAKYKNLKRNLVVCPASVKFAWEDEIKKWTNMSSVIIDSKTDISKIDHKIQFWIINYDILRKHYNQLSKVKFWSMIGDEAQMIKNTSALRTKAFKFISRDISSVVLLSGTPMLSRPNELFSLLNIIDPKEWNNWFIYAKRYCALHQTRWGMDSSGVSNAKELHAKITRYFIRRNKTEVLKELPPKTFIKVPLKLDKENTEKYTTAANNLAEYLREYAKKSNRAIDKAMNAEKLTQLNILRQISSVGKIKMAKEFIENIIDNGEKVLVFSSFTKPLEILKEYFKKKAVIITGKVSMNERKKAVNSFQKDKKVNIFLGGYKSAGIGLTLTEANNFIGLDFPWTNADLQQAIDRLHRPGQKAKSINIYQLIAMNTIDEDMEEILNQKQNVFEQIIEGKKIGKDKSTAIEKATERILSNY